MTDAIKQAIKFCTEVARTAWVRDHPHLMKKADEVRETLKTHQSETVCVRVDELPQGFKPETPFGFDGMPEPAFWTREDVTRLALCEFVAHLIAQKLQEKEERG